MANKEAIVSYLENLEKSRTWLAEQIGTTPYTLCNKLNGKASFNDREISRICTALNISSAAEMAHIFIDGFGESDLLDGSKRPNDLKGKRCKRVTVIHNGKTVAVITAGKTVEAQGYRVKFQS